MILMVVLVLVLVLMLVHFLSLMCLVLRCASLLWLFLANMRHTAIKDRTLEETDATVSKHTEKRRLSLDQLNG